MTGLANTGTDRVRPGATTVAAGKPAAGRGGPAWLAGTVLLLAAAACTPAISYRMVEPQVSADTRYIGPDIEILFAFSDQSIGMSVFNTGDADVMINWDQATFVAPSGDAVRLVSSGGPLIYTVPAGARGSVELTPATWFCHGPTLWHRRAHLRNGLVGQADAERGSSRVRIMLPMRKMGLDGSIADEMYQFTFEVSSDAAEPRPGGGYGNTQIF